MMEPYYSDEAVTLYHGDSLAVLRTLPDRSVDCCVTSPPYFGLRDYGEEGQYGLESSPAEYVGTMRALFAEVRRVLADDGTLWLNLGDSYSVGRTPRHNTKRNDIIWAKPNAMPESVTDRLSGRHEHLFMLSKSARYWFDLDPIREPLLRPEALSEGQSFKNLTAGRSNTTPYGKKDTYQAPAKWAAGSGGRHQDSGPHGVGSDPRGRNPGDVWTVATQPFGEAHFAVMPSELARRAVVAGCKPSGVVLDPFSGSGTTGLVAGQSGRRYVGIDLSRDYLDLSLRTRLAQTSILDGEESS